MKKRKLMHRVAAFLCLLVVVGYMIPSPVLADESIVFPAYPYDAYEDYFIRYNASRNEYYLCTYEGQFYFHDNNYHSNSNYKYPYYCLHGSYRIYELASGSSEWVYDSSGSSEYIRFGGANVALPVAASSKDVLLDDGSVHVPACEGAFEIPSASGGISFRSDGKDFLIQHSSWFDGRDLFDGSFSLPENVNDYPYYIITQDRSKEYTLRYLREKAYLSYHYDELDGSGFVYCGDLLFPSYEDSVEYEFDSSLNEWVESSPSSGVYSFVFIQDREDGMYKSGNKIVSCNFDLCFYNGEKFLEHSDGSELVDSSLGYLQKVKENRVYDKVPLGEVVNDKFTAPWYFDQFTTTGVDLSSGDYFINYYQERWLVKGYGDDDVIEKSDRYLLASYIIPEGYYIETYSEDIDDVLAGQGYEPPTTLDLLWHKFVTTHHYFQVVDAANNKVGGFLHVYYTDDTDSFGVEYIGETLDGNGDFDEDGYKEVIGDNSITSDNTDAGFEELENGTGVDFGDIDGVNDFSGILINYAEGVAGFGNALGAFLSAFPPWVLVSVGLAACLLVAGIVFKVLAG